MYVASCQMWHFLMTRASHCNITLNAAFLTLLHMHTCICSGYGVNQIMYLGTNMRTSPYFCDDKKQSELRKAFYLGAQAVSICYHRNLEDNRMGEIRKTYFSVTKQANLEVGRAWAWAFYLI
jgi:hypothetical protein